MTRIEPDGLVEVGNRFVVIPFFRPGDSTVVVRQRVGIEPQAFGVVGDLQVQLAFLVPHDCPIAIGQGHLLGIVGVIDDLGVVGRGFIERHDVAAQHPTLRSIANQQEFAIGVLNDPGNRDSGDVNRRVSSLTTASGLGMTLVPGSTGVTPAAITGAWAVSRRAVQRRTARMADAVKGLAVESPRIASCPTSEQEMCWHCTASGQAVASNGALRSWQRPPFWRMSLPKRLFSGGEHFQSALRGSPEHPDSESQWHGGLDDLVEGNCPPQPKGKAPSPA